MKILICTLLLITAAWTTATAQFAEEVQILKVELGSTKTLTGSLSEGKAIDASFGYQTGVQCYTEAEKEYFSGNHRLYSFKVPANTKVLVELNTRGNMSLYGYMIPADSYDIPPQLKAVDKSGCSSSFKEMGQLDRVMLKAGSGAVNVVVGVAGIEGADKGAFNLKITTRS